VIRGFNRVLGRLATSRESQRRLVADASHELRTPLTAVRANVELLTGPDRLDLDDFDDLDDIRARVTAELTELGRLVDDLIDLGRVGERPHPAEPIRLDLLAEGVVDRFRARRPEIAFTLDAVPATVDADPDRVEHALTNLVANAVKHGSGTPIAVCVEPGGIVVRDHGPGVAPENRGRVFDRFWRGHQARAVSFGFEAARFAAVMEPSGSGKSTLMHCMSGLDRPTSGGCCSTGRTSPRCRTRRPPSCGGRRWGSSSRPSTSCRRSARWRTSPSRSTWPAAASTATTSTAFLTSSGWGSGSAITGRSCREASSGSPSRAPS